MSVTSNKCEFCNKTFSTKSNLTNHQRKAKFCMLKRGENIESAYNCIYCSKNFSSNQRLLTHQNICAHKNTFMEKEILLKEIVELKNYISKLESQNNNLQDKLASIAIEGVRNKHRDNLYEQEEKTGETEETNFYKPLDSSLVLKDSYQLVCRPEDGYIDVTNLCKAGDKQYKHWKELKKTKAFLQVLSIDAGITTWNLLKFQSGKGKDQKTWVHPQVAINIAQWISPEFDVQVSRWIYEIMLSGKTDIRNPQTTQQLDKLAKENQQYAEKIQYFERKYIQKSRRTEYVEKNVVYIITNNSRESKKEYKIGKTQDLTNRLSTYNTTEEHKVIFVQECDTPEEMDKLEKIVFSELSGLRIKANREWFSGEVEEMIRTVRECKAFIDRRKNW